jgi:hypothetical protein
VHGVDLVDPIMQFNDYGYTMCSTISGINCGIWDYMGYPCKYYEIGLHTVCEVKYDGRYHLYDGSLSALYTLCDGTTIAGVEDVGAEGACAASGGKVELGHIAKYHCITSTGPGGLLTGADCPRSLEGEAKSFNPKVVKYQYFYKCAEYGHRYILNLRDGETYTRYYHRMDESSPGAIPQVRKTDNPNKTPYTADPAYFVTNPHRGLDPESANPRYHIRGNGIRTWAPPLTPAALAGVVYSIAGAKAVEPAGIAPMQAGAPGEVVFKVEGANAITSLKISAVIARQSAEDQAAMAISTTGGLDWQEVWKGGDKLDAPAEVKLRDQVNGCYDVLVKVTMQAKVAAADAQLKSIAFETITEVNSKTQPKLNLGRNTIYVGAGDQTESIIVWPDLRDGKYQPYVIDNHNIAAVTKADSGRYPFMYIDDAALPKGWVTFKVDSPTDITRINYGGRFCVRAPKSGIELNHSFDGGKTWTADYELTTTEAPWDTTHFETLTQIPPGTRSVQFRYFLYSNEGTPAMCGLYSVRMEVDHKVADGAFKPLEVTFNWNERQADYSLVPHSHTQLVEKVPCTYTVDVGGVDHPVTESLKIAHADPGWLGLSPRAPASAPGQQPTKYGYSDGKDPRSAGGEKWVGHWATYGTNFALNKAYTCSIPSSTAYKAGDQEGEHKLTDGIAGCGYAGGTAYSYGLYWDHPKDLRITVDLEQARQLGGFRIHVHGYPWLDAMKGEFPEKVEVLTSSDNKEFASQGQFNFNLRWKDVPVNFMWPDSEQFQGHMFDLILPKPAPGVEARYVQFKVDSPRSVGITEVQALDWIKYEPFDLKIALPGDKGNGK